MQPRPCPAARRRSDPDPLPSVPQAAALFRSNRLDRRVFLAKLARRARERNGDRALAVAKEVARCDLLPFADSLAFFWDACPKLKGALCESISSLKMLVDCDPHEGPALQLVLSIAETDMASILCCSPGQALIQKCICHVLTCPQDKVTLNESLSLSAEDFVAAIYQTVENQPASLHARHVAKMVDLLDNAAVLSALVKHCESAFACADSVACCLRLAQVLCARIPDGRDVGGLNEGGQLAYIAHLTEVSNLAPALLLSSLEANLDKDPIWALRVQRKFLHSLPKHLRAGKGRSAYMDRAKVRMNSDGVGDDVVQLLPGDTESAARALQVTARSRPWMLKQISSLLPPRLLASYELENRLAKRHVPSTPLHEDLGHSHEPGDVEIRIVQLLNVEALDKSSFSGFLGQHLEQLALNCKTLEALAEDADGRKATAALLIVLGTAKLPCELRLRVFQASALTRSGTPSEVIGIPVLTECASMLGSSDGHNKMLTDFVALLHSAQRRVVYMRLLWNVRFGLEAGLRAMEAGVRVLVRSGSVEGAGPLRYLRERVEACLLPGEEAGMAALDALDAMEPITEFVTLEEFINVETSPDMRQGCFPGAAQRIGFLLGVLRERFPLDEAWSCALHALIRAPVECDCALLCALQVLYPRDETGPHEMFLQVWKAWATTCDSTEELFQGTLNALSLAEVLCPPVLHRLSRSSELRDELGWNKILPWPETMKRFAEE